MAILPWPAEQPTLTDGTVTLRPWAEADAGTVFEACQDPAIQRWTAVPVPYLREHAAAFAGPIPVEQWRYQGGALFAVAPPSGGTALGSCGLVAIDPDHLVAEVGYWTAPWARGRGTARAAVRLVSAWALAEGGLARLELYVEPANAASRAVAEDAGFRREGILRSKLLHRGARRDVMLYARVR